MTADLLIFKRNGDHYEVKITPQMRRGYNPDNVIIKVNMNNYKDVTLFLHDLEDLYNVNIEKAVKQYLFEKDHNWPF